MSLRGGANPLIGGPFPASFRCPTDNEGRFGELHRSPRRERRGLLASFGLRPVISRAEIAPLGNRPKTPLDGRAALLIT
jgi:hypothetical protein